MFTRKENDKKTLNLADYSTPELETMRLEIKKQKLPEIKADLDTFIDTTQNTLVSIEKQYPELQGWGSYTEVSRVISMLEGYGSGSLDAKGYIYNLETINLETKKATFYYKGTRGLVQLHLSTLFFTPTIISKIRAMDAAHIGYYCSITDGLTKPFLSQENSFNSNTKPTLLEGTLNILAIERDGKLLIQDTNRSLKLKKCPIDIYNNPPLLESFSSSQALYIGYLSGKSNLVKDKINPRRPFYLQVIK